MFLMIYYSVFFFFFLLMSTKEHKFKPSGLGWGQVASLVFVLFRYW